ESWHRELAIAALGMPVVVSMTLVMSADPGARVPGVVLGITLCAAIVFWEWPVLATSWWSIAAIIPPVLGLCLCLWQYHVWGDQGVSLRALQIMVPITVATWMLGIVGWLIMRYFDATVVGGAAPSWGDGVVLAAALVLPAVLFVAVPLAGRGGQL